MESPTAEVIAGAGTDPSVIEPAPVDTPLFELDNVIVTPHTAGVTAASLHRMGDWTVQNIVDGIDGTLNLEHVINKAVLSPSSYCEFYEE